MSGELAELLRAMPKVELHLHLEGTLEPEMMLRMAARNHVSLPYRTAAEAARAYRFPNLQGFLDLYALGARCLVTEEDFYELAMAYFSRCREQNIVHAEVFFDPQGHLARGVAMGTLFAGIEAARDRIFREAGMTTELVLCFERDRPAANTVELLEEACLAGEIVGIGLDSAERGNPPGKFREVFGAAAALGLHRVAHAGEEGPPAYIWEALQVLQAERVDHGVRCTEDPALVAYLAERRIPLTVCPLSNVALGVFPSLEAHNLGQLFEAGLAVTVHSDDPAYFGGYLTENLVSVLAAQQMGIREAVALQRNGIDAAFCSAERKAGLHRQLSGFLESWGIPV